MPGTGENSVYLSAGMCKHSFYYKNLDARRIRDAVELAEDQQAVRDQLKEQGLVALLPMMRYCRGRAGFPPGR